MSNTLKISSLLALSLAIAPFAAPAVHAAPARRAANGASWIELKVATDKQRYDAGEPIKVNLVATNTQSRKAYLKFSSGQRFDLQLFRLGDNAPVYTWSANKMFNMMVSHIPLQQGQSETYDATIGDEAGALKPGAYRLEAHLANSSQITAQPIFFAVESPAEPTDTSTDAAQKATLSATTDKNVYDVGEAVKVKFALQNQASAPTTFHFNSGQTYDVFVRNAAGAMVWSWGANKRFIMALREVTLAPHEKQNFDVQWDGRALPDYQITPGKYTLETVYKSDPAVRATPVEIEIR